MIRRAVIALCFALVTTSCGAPVDRDAKPILLAWTAAHGRSMLPAFPEYAILQIEIGVPFDQLKVGDTVIYWDYRRGPMAFTHHRLIRRQGDGWIAQGDNNDDADQSWVTRDNYYARTTGLFVVPGPDAPAVQETPKPKSKLL